MSFTTLTTINKLSSRIRIQVKKFKHHCSYILVFLYKICNYKLKYSHVSLTNSKVSWPLLKQWINNFLFNHFLWFFTNKRRWCDFCLLSNLLTSTWLKSIVMLSHSLKNKNKFVFTAYINIAIKEKSTNKS